MSLRQIFPASNFQRRVTGRKQNKQAVPRALARTYNLAEVWPHASDGSQRRQLITVDLEYSAGLATSSTLSATLGSIISSLSNYAGYASYTGLFDQYRFDQLEVWINPAVSVATPDFPEQGTWVTAVDLDDSSSPGSYQAVSMAQGAMQTSVLACHYHKWVPAIDMAAYSGAFTSYANLTGQWVDCSSPGVNQYGIKYAISTTTRAIAFNFILRARVSFRGIAIA